MPHLDFANDIFLLDQDKMEALEHFKAIESSAKKVGLSINYDKTKIMIRNIENPRTEVIEDHTVTTIAEKTYLEVVGDFKYLGAYIVNSHIDVKRRKTLAWSQFWKFTTVWKSKEIILSVKILLFDSLLLSFLFYNSDTWVATKVMKKEIDSFGTSCYQYMQGI